MDLADRAQKKLGHQIDRPVTNDLVINSMVPEYMRVRMGIGLWDKVSVFFDRREEMELLENMLESRKIVPDRSH